MKLFALPLLLSLSIPTFVYSAVETAPGPNPIKMRVEQENKMEVSKISKTQIRTLKIILDNSSHDEIALKIKYAYFGHSVKDHTIVPISEGEKDVTVKPAITSEAITEPGKATAHGSVKKAPAFGNVIAGHGVQVFQGEKLVAEFYDPPTMKEEMGKASATKNAKK